MEQGGGGYSGAPGYVNNPAFQNVPFSGVIPEGTYDIGVPFSSRRGRPTIPLTPREGVAPGRSGFEIHADNRRGDQSASTGCVIQVPDARRQIIESGDNVLRVIP